MSVTPPNIPAPAFQFMDYDVRPVGENDRAYMAELIEADEYHRENMTPDFFLKRERGEDAWALEKDGKVLLYFKTQTAVRIGMLFAQGGTRNEREENRLALLYGLAWLEVILAGNGFREILTDTEGPALEVFLKRHLGFRDAGRTFSRPVSARGQAKANGEDWGVSPQATERAG